MIQAIHLKSSFYKIIEYLSSALVLLFLLLYSYANFFVVPYIGFNYNPTDGEVGNVWVKHPASQTIQQGDHLVKVGPLTWTEFIADSRQFLFRGKQSGDNIDILFQRGDQTISVQWTLPGPNLVEIIDRLSALWLGIMFWLAGTATILLVRPRSITRGLLIAFYLLFAPWLLIGWMSFSGVWDTRILARSLAWIVAVLYTHLNWVFPRPLGRIPPALLWAAYLSAGILSILEFFQLLPSQAYIFGIMVALAVSVVLLILHAILQPDVHRDLKVLAVAILFAVGSGILLSTQATSFVNLNLWLVWLAFLSLTTIPGAYFYIIYRRQLGGLELRTNRIISLYLFTILLLLISTFFIWFTTTRINDLGVEIAIEISLLFFTGIVAAMIYPSFQRLIERRVLGIPLPPSQLVDAYAAKITTSLDSESLVTLLKDEILLSLLIRQSALLGVKGGNYSYILYSQEVADEHLPTQADIPNLIGLSNKYLIEVESPLPNSLGWIRLVLPLEAGGKLIGIWLLGRRDPDNYYAQSEIHVLQTIANQTAIALINIAHTRLLHTLYQVDIERQEKERAALARGLHDEVLNHLAALFMHQPSFNGIAPIEENKEEITNYLREVISELRPAMLNYGLRPAIDELVDNLSQRISGYPTFEVDLETDLVRFDPNVEQHVFRIVQQACENALRHAHANCIRISGALKSDSIILKVDDDGLGFPTPGSQDLEQLLVQAHYGLVGMYERASIIGADLNIQSELGRGTRVELIWPKSVQVGSPIINSVQAG